MSTTTLAPAATAVVLICSRVGLAPGDPVRPYGPRSWAKFATRMARHHVAGPDALLGLEAAEIERLLDYPPIEAERLARLLDRGAHAAIELERFASRGIWTVTILDAEYPGRLAERLGSYAPPVLFGAGSPGLLQRPGFAIVGSRDADEASIAFCERVASGAVAGGLCVISGGARGVDQAAMRTAFARGGQVVGVLPDGLERRIREVETRSGLADGDLLLLSAVHPAAPFSVGAAMARNKLVYALALATVVVGSASGQGGTWAGAVEALERGFGPVIVRSDRDAPAGNHELIARGGIPVAAADIPDELTVDWLSALAGAAEVGVAEARAGYTATAAPVQEKLFG